MKLLITSFLSLLIVLQSVSVFINIGNELKEVVTDYQLHKSKYGDDFATFWSKHFGELKEQHKAQHKKEHQPSHDQNIHISHIEFALLRSFIPYKIKGNFEVKNNNFYYRSIFSEHKKTKILQPPRLIA